MLSKHEDKGFVVVAINTYPSQDDRVLESINEYGFLPLRTPTDDWSKNTLKITSTPSNFLLDAEGRVIFKPDVSNAEAARELDRQVAMLLARRSAQAKK